ncbi:PREDICTED: probable vacuolar amino acid transporter YPQ1 isoform X2 [Nelumbo nucifera]|uniref:Probable vacuolar amino acid transporter YPQ1 isoform X2 n=1 Tax=Nelumbo nucifera TaxID=4432 RepID=A0A1U8A098_NELNU|nr:PREDICTED: probable vacuolar amino acid transporter YPQ1 isoform X2 [Nelumbo nucifera]
MVNRISHAYCSKQKKPCVGWVEIYFKDCLCNLSDEISFAFGFFSLICWGVAEIPQIITNFNTKSGQGVSLAFLLTWVVGDVFNLVGCLLEPATLPTQFYTAVLYTVTTVVLVLQCLYYDRICLWWKSKGKQSYVDEETKPLNSKLLDTSVPIPSSGPQEASPSRDLYYTSARSLASSSTPTLGSYLGISRSGPSAVEEQSDSSEDEAFPVYDKKSSSQPKRTPPSVGYGAFLGASANLPFRSMALMEGYLASTGRRLHETEVANNVYGLLLGWLMAAIYMGGRLPQIFLNIRRGSVEGLNPLMFIFALIANVTYVGSILVRSTEWTRIKANMPWLFDAIVCVALDLFIIVQYMYYKSGQKRRASSQQGYMEAVKPIVS